MKTQDLFSLVSGLSGVTRFSMLKMVHRETVLEHTGMIVIFAFVLGTKLNQFSGHKFNMELLLGKALIHDWDETITGDIARPTKYFSTTLRSELSALEADGVRNITDTLAIPEAYVLHEDAKEGAEGNLVKLCDIACAIHRCWEETLVFSNMHFTLPASRLRMVLHNTVKSLQLGTMSAEQWRIINNFALELNNFLNEVLQRGNGHLKEMANAD